MRDSDAALKREQESYRQMQVSPHIHRHINTMYMLCCDGNSLRRMLEIGKTKEASHVGN